MVLLCVRPDDVEEVLDEIDVPHDRVAISAVAGWSIDALLARLPHRPEVSRIIPLPAVRELRGTTAVYPTHPVVDEVFGPLGGTVAATSEAQFDAMSAATATVSAHFTYLATITGWLAGQGLPDSEAESFVRSIFAEVGASLVHDDAPLQALDRNLARVSGQR